MPRVLPAAGLVLPFFVIGVVVGVASAAVHATWWGLPLAIAATATTAYVAPAGWRARIPFVLGWAAVVGLLSVPTSEGDYLIAGDVSGYALLGFGVVLVVTGFVTLPPPRRNSSPDASTS